MRFLLKLMTKVGVLQWLDNKLRITYHQEINHQISLILRSQIDLINRLKDLPSHSLRTLPRKQ